MTAKEICDAYVRATRTAELFSKPEAVEKGFTIFVGTIILRSKEPLRTCEDLHGYIMHIRNSILQESGS